MCVFRPVLHFESVRVLLVVRVVPFLVLVFRMFLSGSTVPLLCLCCASAIHQQFSCCASSVRVLSNKRLSNQHSPLFHSHLLPHSQFLQPGGDEVVSLVAGVLQKGGQRRGGRHHPFPLPLQITHPLRFVAGDGEEELVEDRCGAWRRSGWHVGSARCP